jgi:putative transposase
MLVEIPPKYGVAEIMGYLKGKSSLMIFDRHANLKDTYGTGISGVVDIMQIR